MKELIFVLLPAEIFYLISNFLLPECQDGRQIFKFSADWRNFCNSSKKHCLGWKKQTQIIDLKPLYADKFCKSSKFRDRVYGMVDNAATQLGLIFNRSWGHCFDRLIKLEDCIRVRGIVADRCMFDGLPGFPLDDLCLRMCQIKQLHPHSPPVRRFDCNQCTVENLHLIDADKLNITEEASFRHVKLKNYETLAHLQSLSIIWCESITDVSCFRNLTKLTLHRCSNITDVSSLGNVHELELTDCNEVTDVSSLGRVYSLNLSGCQKIRDVSALGNVHILNLDSCSNVIDVSALKNVYELHLTGFKGVSISGLQNVVKLFLNHSHKVTDISLLRKVEVLHVECCYRVSHFHGLDKINELSVGDHLNEDEMAGILDMKSGIELFERLITFHAFGMILRLEEEGDDEVNSSSTIITWKHFVQLESLSLNFCCFHIFPNEFFEHLTSLSVIDCEGFESLILDLPSLRELVISGCNALETLHLLAVRKSGFIKHSTIALVEISACGPLRVTISRKVNNLRFLSSEELVQLTVENTIQQLKVIKCPNFRIQRSSAPIYNIVCEDDSQPEVDLTLTNYADDD
jgi:hypothetical protein